jgi:hypothetical protein
LASYLATGAFGYIQEDNNRIDLLREVARHLKDGKVFKTLDFGHTNGFKFQVSSFKVAMLLELSFGESYP